MKKLLLLLGIVAFVGSAYAQEELIQNGDFSNVEDTVNWGWWGLATIEFEMTIENEMAELTITKDDQDQGWGVQMFQPKAGGNMEVTEGQDYTFKFDAMCETGTRIIRIGVQGTGSGFPFYVGDTVELSEEMTTYEFADTSMVADTACRFIVWLGGQGTNGVTMDNISVTLGTNLTSVETPSFYDEVVVYPNPANNMIHVNSTDFEFMEIYDVAGKLVKRIQNSGASFDVSDLNKGLYIVRLAGSEPFTTKLLVE